MAHHTRRRTTDQPSVPGRTLRHLVALIIALTTVMLAVPAASPTAAQETPGTGAIEVHVSECPPGYDGANLYGDCHANGLTGVDVQISGASSDSKATEGATGAVRFANIPAGSYTIQVGLPDEGQQYRTYCSPEDGDTRIPISPENSNPGSLDLAEGQVIICDFHVVPPAEDVPVDPPADPADPVTPEELAQVTVNPASCPEGTDPGAGFDALAAACSEPVENVTFSWGDTSGIIETINTDSGAVVFDGIEPGTYTLYSDVPLADADEVLSCVADGGNRYQKEFSANGITSFTNIQREQIVCDWFIVPVVAGEADTPDALQPPADSEDVRGVESGGSLVVHLSLCPEGYTGDEIYDTCHGEGIADQAFTLTGPDGEVSATTTVPQSPGPGIVEFTGLPSGEYTLAGGPPGDFGTVRLYCTTQPDGAFVETSLDSTRATFAMGEGQDILCDWYYIPENAQGETPTPTVTPEPEQRAEIVTTLLACDPGETMAGASYSDFASVCGETRDGVAFSLGDVGAPPLTANTGVSGPGAVRFYDLLPADYTLTPSLPDGLSNAAVFCQIDGGDRYQKTITSGSTTFTNVNGESITCEWFVTQPSASAPAPEPTGPSGSITVREFLCEGDQSEIKDWEQECKAGSTGATFTVASPDGGITLTSATNANGIATFSSLPDGFYTLKQNDGIWCKAKAERVDSQSRVIVEGGQNTDVFLYQCSQVTDLPSTGTGPGIGMIDDAAWWEAVSPTQMALMGAGVLGAMILAGWGVSRRLTA